MDFIPDLHLRDAPDLAASEVATHILLSRQVHGDLTWLVVEGHADDRLFDRFVDIDRTRIACACGRQAVLLVSEKLARFNRREGFVGIIDLDFDGVTGGVPFAPPLFATDSHDIETMCLATDHAVGAVLSEHCDRGKRRDYRSRTGLTVRKALLKAARHIGLVRLASLDGRMGLWVAEWDHASHYPLFISDLSVDEEALYSFLGSVPTLRRDGASKTCTPNEIRRLRAAVRKLETLHAVCSSLHLACGHDICKILSCSIGPGRVLGGRSVTPSEIERDLRLAYPEHVFKRTQLYASLAGWQVDNAGWTLLCKE